MARLLFLKSTSLLAATVHGDALLEDMFQPIKTSKLPPLKATT
jgi:hypothetical protein